MMMKPNQANGNSQGLELLIEKLHQHYDDQTCDIILNGMREKRVVSLRVNTLKKSKDEIKQALDTSHIMYHDVSWYDDVLIVETKESLLEELDMFKHGWIYLQSLSSMIPAVIMDAKPKQTILDMAAAPGGKTTLLALLTQDQASITAIEAHPIRAEKLKFNINRQGIKHVSVMVKDARMLDPYFIFDRILLDAPCSGSGTILLNDPKTFSYFTQKLIDKSVETQKALIKKAVDLLKPGETMVYSTCSVLPDENDNIIQSILKSGWVEVVPIEDDKWHSIPTLPTQIPGTLLIPPSQYYEGFFIAKLKKKVKK
ncbi:MAG TPA: Fmu (Sun) domain-containing protein [Acholeplasmataceae bacterium]|nr:Fmu (Sun) domain-containing protein [Acholeplasmataceae bacterium]